MRHAVLFGLCTFMALTASHSAAVADGLETPAQVAWRERIEAQLTRVEMSVAALDKAKPVAGSLLARVTSVHARLHALEKTAKVELGTIKGTDDLSHLTMDVTSLGTRARVLIDARSPKKPSPPALPPAKVPSSGGGAPTPPAGPSPSGPQQAPRAWPEQLEFSATAKVVYQETGEWFISKNQRSGLGNDFLMDGYSGTVAFSLRAKGLRKEITSADIRVAVKLRAPFASDDNTYRIYDVRWTSEIAQSGRFGNDSLKNYPRYAAIEASGPIEWIKEPRLVTLPLTAEAYVRSITLPGGEVIEFEIPSLVSKRD